MSASQNENGCPAKCARVPVKGFEFEGMTVCLDPDNLPGGSGVEPGPDNTHLVSRGGSLAWDPIAPGGDGVNYSFEEQWTGKLWTDGKKIYQKTIDCGPMPIETTKVVDTGIINIDSVIAFGGTASSETHVLNIPRATPHLTGLVDLLFNLMDGPATIDIETATQNWSAYKNTSITIQYTCTDR